jgi:hypothetical protein
MALPDFGKLIHGLEEIFDGIINITEGVVKTVEVAPIGGLYLMLDTFVVLQYTAVFLFTNFTCSIQMLSNLTSCFMYYMLDVVGKVCYLPISIILFIISMTAMPGIYDYENQFWESLDSLDRQIFKYTKIHFLHYPKSVRDKCYNCKRMKVDVFGKLIKGYISDIEDPIFNLAFGGIEEFFYGIMEVIKGVMDFLSPLMSIL